MILSLPRCGSTTLAHILNCHPDIRCLIEPFHPLRYGGRFHGLAKTHSIDYALELIRKQFNGIKHVYESTGFPFGDRPGLNDQICLAPRTDIIVIMRRNLLRRVVSNCISRQTRYWIGTRAGFRERLESVELRALSAEMVRRQIELDQAAVSNRLQWLLEHNIPVMPLYYEDVFGGAGSDVDKLRFSNSLLEFLGFAPITSEQFAEKWERLFDPADNQWASPEIYRRIPGIDRIENEFGSDETGWLFR